MNYWTAAQVRMLLLLSSEFNALSAAKRAGGACQNKCVIYDFFKDIIQFYKTLKVEVILYEKEGNGNEKRKKEERKSDR